MLTIISPLPEEPPLLYKILQYTGMGDISLENAQGEFRIHYLVTLCEIPSTLANGDV